MSPRNQKKMSAEFIDDRSTNYPLVKINFIMMAIAGVMIIVGFLLMLGGSSNGPEFNYDIFSTRRIVVGPAIALAGFVFMGIAIMWRKNDKKTEK